MGVATSQAPSVTGYSFATLDNANDVTFNQLLGINNEGVSPWWPTRARRTRA